MKAVQVTELGGPEVLELVDIELPALGGTDLLVRTAAIGVNYIDTYYRKGEYKKALPFVPGDEGAGTVEAVGDQVSDFRVGDRVAWTGAAGSYAQQVVVPQGVAVKIGAEIPSDVAASIFAQGLTAHYLAYSTYGIQSGDSVLIHAGAGGVGLLLTQIAARLGATVITTVSTDEKAELSMQAGAARVLRYGDDIPARVREETGGRGAHVVYDGVGASTFDASLASTRVRGTVVLFGAASGQVPPFDPQRLNAAGSLFLTRPTLRDYIRDAEEFRWRATSLLDGISEGWLRVHVGARYALADASVAHADLEARKTSGAVVLLP